MTITRGDQYLIVATALAFTAAACSDKGSTDSLSSSVATFIEYKNAQNYKALWNASSDSFRLSNQNNEKDYERYVKSHGFHSSAVDVLRTDASTSDATIRVRVRYVEDGGRDAGSAIEDWRFVQKGGNWYFDGYRTISESAPSGG